MKNYSAVSLPMAEGGKVSNCLVGFDYYGVPKASKHKDEAFEVIRMMLNKDLQKLMDNIPANKEILADPNYAKEFIKGRSCQGTFKWFILRSCSL
jgi:ABC-type glycerol-3-phosphate transport system substrate-binding protein